MHRELMSATREQQVDHENRDGLDNQRFNLRIATRSQNQHNKAAYKNNTSGYKGVTYDRQTGRWFARIMHEGVRHNLGRHLTPEIADTVVRDARKRLHGTFARHNESET